MAEAPYQREWRPIGDRHGLRISHRNAEGTGDDPASDGPAVVFTLLADDGRLVLRHEVPRVLAADWVAALIGILDRPVGRLHSPEEWGGQADELARLRRDLQALPGTGERPG